MPSPARSWTSGSPSSWTGRSPTICCSSWSGPTGSSGCGLGYKEASQSGHNAFQLRQSYQSDWARPEDLSLDLTALDMDGLYESIVRQIAGDAITAPEAETLKEAVEQTKEKEKRLRQIEALRAKMKKEKSLAKQMEIRREIMRLEEL